MMRKMIVFSMTVLLCSFAGAQEKTEQINTGQDFLKPLTRFDIRQQLKQNNGDTDSYITTFRVDKPILLDGGKAGILSARLDIPLVVSDAVGNDNPNGDTEFGVGDLLTQFAYIFPKDKTNELGFGIDGFGFGTQLIWPTAGKSILGGEKYLVAPLVGAKWDMPQISEGSWFTPVFRYFFDYADYGNGGKNRDDIGELAIQPQVYINTKAWDWPVDFVHFWGGKDIRINFENGSTKGSGDVFIPFDIMVGKMLNKSTVVSVEFATPLVNNYDLYDWIIEFRIGFFF